MPQRPTYMITTAIPYANGAPHIGHAYERIATDAIARFKRLDGLDMLFVTGMDEHGQKMQQTAAREGLTPQQFADRTAAQFERMGDMLNARADDIVRTTQARHKARLPRRSGGGWRRTATSICRNIPAGIRCATRPISTKANSRRRDGKKLAPTRRAGRMGRGGELVLQALGLCGQAARALRRASRIRHAGKIPKRDRRLREARAHRSLDQPRDPRLGRCRFRRARNHAKHVMYVWVDALTNYITATGFPTDRRARARFWPADAHVIGKDITRFHAIYWPAFLMSAGLPVPKQIVVHGFLFNRGEKMSKSVGNVVDPMEMAERYGVDQLRYFFLREVPFGQDGNYSHEAIVARINADLANDLGNLAQRSLSMIAKNCGGAVPRQGALRTPTWPFSREAADALAKRARQWRLTRRITLWPRFSTSWRRPIAISPAKSPGPRRRPIRRAWRRCFT